MSRHRDIRNLDYDEEYDHAIDDEVYGHSLEDSEYGISPTTEEYLYSQKKDANYGFSAYFPDSANIKEEEEDEEEEPGRATGRRDSSNYERPRLSSENEMRLNSVLDEIRNVVGDHFQDHEMVPLVLDNDYDLETSLNALLNKKPGQDSVPRQAVKPSRPTSSQHLTKRNNQKTLKDEKSTKPDKVKPNVTPVIVKKPKSVVKGFEPKTNGEDCRPGTFNTLHDTKDGTVEAPKENIPVTPKPPPRIRDKAVDVVKKYEELRGKAKDLLNMVVVGHVDAGKSTLMGHLLYLQGIVAQRTMHKYEQESKKIGKQSFMYAWVLDDTEEERSRGITVDVAQRVFDAGSKTVTLLDAPGHRDFIPNMITGAVRADVAVLVVDASKGGFEAGFESGGQTREHAILVRSLGISELVVAVNKLDSISWSQTRFDEIVASLQQFLKLVGFKSSDVTFVPCSGLTGENLMRPATEEELTSWYSGLTLLASIDKLKVPERAVTKPVRMCVSDIYKGQGSAMCVAGRLESGYVQNGDRLLLLPQNDVVSVKLVESDHADELGHSFAGDHLTVTLSGVDPNVLHVGDFLCDPERPLPQATQIHARVVVFNAVVPIIKGSMFDFHYQSLTETARVSKLVSLVHKSTGQVLKQRPRALLKNSSAVIELRFERPLCLELYKDSKELGRFMLRTNGVTMAAGMIVLILN